MKERYPNLSLKAQNALWEIVRPKTNTTDCFLHNCIKRFPIVTSAPFEEYGSPCKQYIVGRNKYGLRVENIAQIAKLLNTNSNAFGIPSWFWDPNKYWKNVIWHPAYGSTNPPNFNNDWEFFSYFNYGTNEPAILNWLFCRAHGFKWPANLTHDRKNYLYSGDGSEILFYPILEEGLTGLSPKIPDPNSTDKPEIYVAIEFPPMYVDESVNSPGSDLSTLDFSLSIERLEINNGAPTVLCREWEKKEINEEREELNGPRVNGRIDPSRNVIATITAKSSVFKSGSDYTMSIELSLIPKTLLLHAGSVLIYEQINATSLLIKQNSIHSQLQKLFNKLCTSSHPTIKKRIEELLHLIGFNIYQKS